MTDNPPFDTTPDHPLHGRRVHGRRRGKPLRTRQQTLVDTVLPALLITADSLAANTDPRQFFAQPVTEVWLEIGFGKGEHLLWQAERHPDIGFIGVEPFIDGVASLLAGIEDKGLTNIRLFRDDARYLMDHLADASIGRCFLLFPDPWPKARHHKRRFVNPGNLNEMARCIRPGAELRIGTDHADYRGWILAHMLRQEHFAWAVSSPRDCLSRPEDWPETRYEAKGAREGRPSIYLSYRRQEPHNRS